MDCDFVDVTTPAGLTLRAAVTGQGPLVVLVHGFPESWYSWRHQIGPIAAAGFRVAALQVRGYGDSAKPQDVAAYAITELAGDVAALIDALEPSGQAILIGHDWGAVIVQTTALVHPEKVRAIASLSVPAFMHGARKPSDIWAEIYADRFYYMRYFQPEGVAEAEFEPDLDRFVRVFFLSLSAQGSMTDNGLFRPKGTTRLLDGLPDPGTDLPAWLSQDDVDYYAESFRKGGLRGPLNRYRCVDRDWTLMAPYADRMIDQPSLFIAGLQEPTRYMVPGVDRFDNPVPRFTDCRGVHLLDGAGHWVQQEKPQEVTRLLVDFVKGI